MEHEHSSRDIPMDVINAILVLLPTKSLIRFTCVCKSWLRLIKNNHQFAITHFRTRAISCCTLMDNADYMMKYPESGNGAFDVYSLTKDKNLKVVKKFEFIPEIKNFSFSNFCHGIMCLYVYPPKTRGKFMLLNTTIHEVVLVPVSTNIAKYGFSYFGIGFDSATNDYKILAIIGPANGGLRHGFSWLLDVYSVSNGCWHSIPAKNFEITRVTSFQGHPVSNANGRRLSFLNQHVKCLYTFDLVDEVFQETPMPSSVTTTRNYVLALPSSQWQACISSYDIGGRTLDIWVLKGSILKQGTHSYVGDAHDHLWSKHVSLKFPDHWVVLLGNLWMNDEELLVNVLKKGEPEQSLEEVFVYNLGSKQLKESGLRQGENVSTSNITGEGPGCYTESLVSMKALGPSYSDDTLSPEDSICSKDEIYEHQTSEKKIDNGSVYSFREVSERHDVIWSYSFNLDNN